MFRLFQLAEHIFALFTHATEKLISDSTRSPNPAHTTRITRSKNKTQNNEMTSNTALLSAAAHAMLSSDLLPNVNLSNWEKLVTDDEFRDFMKLVEKYKYPNHTQETALPKCHDYCTSELYQMLRTYNGVHGYVALLVSVMTIHIIQYISE